MVAASKALATGRRAAKVKKVRIAPEALQKKQIVLQEHDHVHADASPKADGQKYATLLSDTADQGQLQKALAREGHRVEDIAGAVAILSTSRGGRAQILRLDCYHRMVVGRFEQW
ncbi:uncharacterized protein PFL1_03422 [Pseudozyma flocculosa PF-1]|uniref:Uncharacterized protein n=1 Tax=Pseudozyma flocculosa PF-1 TaxID=1277687 RepID=A0A061H9K8_9BASI|nr:uncharacterized protein PFL1_03422 [Pseudozyma flocculosa PF-1]EPQ29134.1 hypothetical protein PFL1_03422 [Pseudozyma flocculosa PF-1]